MTCDLYRHWDVHGCLLYVGISGASLQRLLAHRSLSPWYQDIATVTIEKFETRAAACRAEAAAIKSEMPAYNVDFTPRDFQREVGAAMEPEVFNFKRALSDLMQADAERVMPDLLEVISLGLEAFERKRDFIGLDAAIGIDPAAIDEGKE